MNLKKAISGLLFLSALGYVHAEDADDDDDDDDWGLCYYDKECKYSCGDAQSPEDCLQYQQGHPDAIPIDVPYFMGPGFDCVQTTEVVDQMGYCCTSCDEGVEGFMCTEYYNNPDGCVKQGYDYFFNKIDAVYADTESLEGFCDKVDEEGNKISSGSGDPHFKTWTGAKFDYHGECDLVLIDNPTFMDGLGLKLHIRTTRINYFSYIERIALKIGDDVLEFANDVDKFSINGKEAEPIRRWRNTTLGDYLVRRDKKAISVRLSQENYKRGSPRIDFIQRNIGWPAVVVNSEGTDLFKGSLGLLGDWATGRRFARDGKTVMDGDDATDFALEWQVRDTEPLLFNDARAPQFPTQCTPPAKMLGNRLGSTLMRAQAEEVCASWKDSKEECIFDVMATRDIEVAKEGAIKTS